MYTRNRVLFLQNLFRRYTDNEHYLKISAVLSHINANGYGADKRTILSDIDALIESGMDIEYVHNKGYHLKSRPFSLSILKLLADAIASFRFLTVKDSEKLLKLLESLCSIYESPALRQGIVYGLVNLVKS